MSHGDRYYVAPHGSRWAVYDLATDQPVGKPHDTRQTAERSAARRNPKREPMSLFAQPGSKPPGAPIPPGVLRGPADADHYRVKVGRFGDRWYADPLPACALAPGTDSTFPSVTTVKKASGSDWTFVGLKRVNVALETDPKALDGLDFATRGDRLRSINKLGLSAAAERGTNVHSMLETALRGGDWAALVKQGEPGYEYTRAVGAFLDREQPELIAAELVCIHRDLNGVGYGGASDGIVGLKVQGGVYAVDWKSRGEDSEHGAYPEEGAQLGAYAGAQYMIAEGAAGPERQRLPRVDGGLIVSIKPDGYRCYPIDLAKGFAHFAALHSWWVARRAERDCVGRPWAPRADKPAPASDTPRLDIATQVPFASSTDELMALYKQAVDLGVWTDDIRALFSQRKAELTAA